MKFAVKAWSSGGGRSGLLQLGGCPLDTPAVLLSTRKGLPFFLSPDLLSSLPSPHSRLLHLCPLHFFEGLSLQTVSSMGGLHKLLSLPDHHYLSVLRDSIDCVPDPSATNKFGASFDTPYGRFLVKPADYVDMISSMKPNIWATLADEVPNTVSAKRNKTSVERTLRWLDECIALSPVGCGAIFGSIVGGDSVEERRRCAQDVANRSLSGYWIGGFGLGENTENLAALMNAVTECLPDEKPRLVSGLGTPEEILEGVAAGVDLFNSAYIYDLTLRGFALIFPAESIKADLAKFVSVGSGGDRTKINLRETGFRCYTCCNHTKAYIHHLLNVKELLAHILLEIHNTHHYLGFFASIREAIREGQFEELRRQFLDKTDCVSE
ncbi:PREDICTED: queuine tRNA-ribosyltransferase accessory subunit 2-like isoform X2 [Tarenaya hassleriana]|uniref:queuine tRNA-ribosyltransferase accessory subunit 2-like isoform X2 n=1 Tax=Tarenaya hassleriana TaxID=28532 RepID=UPI00053C9CC6|nr:PREDICTED: queuine tRNA-ribosyltransferase accessory subunit 2-like isoform X2 [Tarenaya hassleriana]